MKERPILFSAPMVLAILEGRKTQTRRVVFKKRTTDFHSIEERDDGSLWPWRETDDAQDHWYQCPYGQPGDRLWVRETWNWFDPAELPAARIGKRAPFTWCQGPRTIEWYAAYSADGQLNHPCNGAPVLWRPSIHMPRWASRILLEVVNVRVERLRDISEADAQAEGIKALSKDGCTVKYGIPDRDGLPGNDDYGWHWHNWLSSAVLAYRQLWDQINGNGSWDKNPWVWVVEFKRVDNNGGAA